MGMDLGDVHVCVERADEGDSSSAALILRGG